MSYGFAEAAASFPEPFRLLIRETAASTNDDLRQLAENGAGDGLVLVAMQQTAGRGRRGAKWHAPPGEALVFSILLRPPEPKALWPRFSLIAGLAVAEAIGEFGPSAGIKWPNDVWIAGRKVAGILVEAGADHVVVGIGLNLGTVEFPADIAHSATSLRIETGVDHPAPEVLAAVIRRFAVHHRSAGNGFAAVIDAVRSRCVLTGHQVSFLTASGAHRGEVEAIAAGGELQVRTAAGSQRLMQADEIRIVTDTV